MRRRCFSPKCERYKDYGGRGIAVCDRWLKFENFLEDMGEKPVGVELDRIDNNGHYCKENCRWVTRKENGRNKRNNVIIKYNGERRLICEVAEIIGIPASILRVRKRVLGWSDERTLTEPVRVFTKKEKT